MKILVVGTVATLVGFGGGAFIAGSQLKGDIVERLEAEHEADAAADTLKVAVGSGASGATGVAASASRLAGPGPTDQGGPASYGGQGADFGATNKLAKIFEAMSPEDAAAVLEVMEDSQVQTILLSMGDRQAADILRDFATDRAALLSQLVLLSQAGGS